MQLRGIIDYYYYLMSLHVAFPTSVHIRHGGRYQMERDRERDMNSMLLSHICRDPAALCLCPIWEPGNETQQSNIFLPFLFYPLVIVLD